MSRLPLAKRVAPLAVEITVRDNSVDPKMGDIEVRIVQVEPDYSRRSPDDGNIVSPGPRSDRWSRVLPLRNLVIHGYLSASIHEPDDAWGCKTVYREPYQVELDDARGMADTLEKIEKGLDRLDRNAGSTASFGAYAQRVASILGITLVYRGKDAAVPVSCGIESAVNHAVREWHKAHPVAESVAS